MNLKRCPFCSGSNLTIFIYHACDDDDSDFSHAKVYCVECNAEMNRKSPSTDEALELALSAWNRRDLKNG